MITELVRKSSEVLNLLAMTMVDTVQKKSGQQKGKGEGEEVKSSDATDAPVIFTVEPPEEAEEAEEVENDEEYEEYTDELEEEEEPFSPFDKDDPPDPAELAKLPKVWKKRPTMALKWRREREKARRRQGLSIS